MRSFGLCFTFTVLSYTFAAPFDRRQQQGYAPSDTSNAPGPYRSSLTTDPSLEHSTRDSTSHGPLPYVPSDSQSYPHSESQVYPHRGSSAGNGNLPPSAQSGRSSSHDPPNDYNSGQSSPGYPQQGRSPGAPPQDQLSQEYPQQGQSPDYPQHGQSSAGYPSNGQPPIYGPEEIPPPSQTAENGHSSPHNGNPSSSRPNTPPSSDRLQPDFGTLTKDIPREATLPPTLTAPPGSDFRLNGTNAKGGPHTSSGQPANSAGPNMTTLADPTHPPYVPPNAAEFANKSYVPSTPNAPRNMSNLPASVRQPSKDMEAESTSTHSLEGMPPAVMPTANGTQDHRSNMSVTLPDQSKPVFADLPKRQFGGSTKNPDNFLGGGLGSNMLPDAGMLTPGVLPGADALGGALGGSSHHGAAPAGPGGPTGPGSEPHGGSRGQGPYPNGDASASTRPNYPSAANSRPGAVSEGPSYGGGPSAQSIPPGGDVNPPGPATGRYSGGPSHEGPVAQSSLPRGAAGPLGDSHVSPGGATDNFNVPVSAQSDPSYHHDQGSAPGTMQQSENYMPPTTQKTDHGYRTGGDSFMHEGNAGGSAYNKPYAGETNRW